MWESTAHAYTTMGIQYSSAHRVSALICKLMMNCSGTWFSGGLGSIGFIVVLNDSMIL